MSDLRTPQERAEDRTEQRNEAAERLLERLGIPRTITRVGIVEEALATERRLTEQRPQDCPRCDQPMTDGRCWRHD